jgi:preprotein translocase subunit SecF|tara:strand:+ start:6773 stop:7642 length:870 start_codon:yes stop_codon:yes gene_type:complete
MLNINFIKYHKLAIVFSALLLLMSFFSLSTKFLNLGIDFTGGILLEVRFDKKVEVSKLRSIISNKGIKKFNIQSFDEKDVMIRIPKDENIDQAKLTVEIKKILNSKFPNIEYRKIDFVGPKIGSELIKSAILALLLSCFFVLIYIWYRFDLEFGIWAIIALIHDVVITIGFISVTSLEFNSTSIAALLTVIGYSINDSVVIFDRVRENLQRYKKMPISQVINISLNSTFRRTIITSGTTLVALLALILFGGEILKTFSISLFFGILIGTYSSICVSSSLLIFTDPRKHQ